jgi:hypothetical protein
MRGALSLCLVLAAVALPGSAAAEGAPPAPTPSPQPEWTPPGDSTRGGEGNLHDAPLFEPTGQERRATLTWNPLTLFLVRAELSLEILLTDHHALQLTGFYGATRTNEVYPASDPMMLHEGALTTLFQAGGGELGYRWYSGWAGPRGIYVAPSFLLSYDTATPYRGANTTAEVKGVAIPYWNLGGALDVGYQAILADRWVAGFGAGLQYTVPTHTFPPQELPASVYAIRGLRPRLLLALGVAF